MCAQCHSCVCWCHTSMQMTGDHRSLRHKRRQQPSGAVSFCKVGAREKWWCHCTHPTGVVVAHEQGSNLKLEGVYFFEVWFEKEDPTSWRSPRTSYSADARGTFVIAAEPVPECEKLGASPQTPRIPAGLSPAAGHARSRLRRALQKKKREEKKRK